MLLCHLHAGHEAINVERIPVRMGVHSVSERRQAVAFRKRIRCVANLETWAITGVTLGEDCAERDMRPRSCSLES